MSVDARLDAEEDVSGFFLAGSQLAEQLQLRQVIHHNVAYLIFQRHHQFFRGLVVAEEENLLHGEIHLSGGIQLPAGDNIQPQALFLDDLADRLAAHGLAGIGHQTVAVVKLLHGFAVTAAAAADLLLIHDIERRPKSAGQLHRVAAADGEMPQLVDIQRV